VTFDAVWQVRPDERAVGASSAHVSVYIYPLSAETLEPLALFVRKLPKDSNLAEGGFSGLINQEFLRSFRTNDSISSVRA